MDLDHNFRSALQTLLDTNEIKLLVGCSDEEIAVVCEFHNGETQSGVVLRRE